MVNAYCFSFIKPTFRFLFGWHCRCLEIKSTKDFIIDTFFFFFSCFCLGLFIYLFLYVAKMRQKVNSAKLKCPAERYECLTNCGVWNALRRDTGSYWLRSKSQRLPPLNHTGSYLSLHSSNSSNQQLHLKCPVERYECLTNCAV